MHKAPVSVSAEEDDINTATSTSPTAKDKKDKDRDKDKDTGTSEGRGRGTRLRASAAGTSDRVKMQVSLNFRGVMEMWWLLPYTGCVLCHLEWCIRQMLSSSTIFYNITSMPPNHHTDIYPLLNTYIY